MDLRTAPPAVRALGSYHRGSTYPRDKRGSQHVGASRTASKAPAGADGRHRLRLERRPASRSSRHGNPPQKDVVELSRADRANGRLICDPVDKSPRFERSSRRFPVGNELKSVSASHSIIAPYLFGQVGSSGRPELVGTGPAKDGTDLSVTAFPAGGAADTARQWGPPRPYRVHGPHRAAQEFFRRSASMTGGVPGGPG